MDGMVQWAAAQQQTGNNTQLADGSLAVLRVFAPPVEGDADYDADEDDGSEPEVLDINGYRTPFGIPLLVTVVDPVEDEDGKVGVLTLGGPYGPGVAPAIQPDPTLREIPAFILAQLALLTCDEVRVSRDFLTPHRDSSLPPGVVSERKQHALLYTRLLRDLVDKSPAGQASIKAAAENALLQRERRRAKPAGGRRSQWGSPAAPYPLGWVAQEHDRRPHGPCHRDAW